MTFFKKIKRSFGFSDPEDYDIDEGIDATVKKRVVKNDIVISDTTILYEENNNIKGENPEEKLREMQLKLFDGVITLFNSALPDFLKSSVDVDAQKKYIYDSLDQSLKDYINNIGIETRKVCESQWEKERIRLINEMRMLKSQYKEVESTREEWKRQQLSAERQKRALSTRLHDLEAQVASLEAEKEQYDLENKSLINKLKVSNVKDNDVNALHDEIARLQGLLDEARTEVFNSSLETSDTNVAKIIQEKDEEKKLLINEVENLKNTLEQMRIKESLSDSMINDLNKKVAESLDEIQDKNKEILSLSANLEEQLSNCDTMKQSLAEEKEKYDNILSELNEAKDGLKMIETIQTEMSQFELLKKKKDAKILELEKELSQSKNRVIELEESTESLKSTIENNLYNQAISEKRLLDEIEKLKKSNKGSNTRRKDISKSNVKISAIDHSLDDADWLISIPPEDSSLRVAQQGEDKDFGYQEPSRKKTPENDAQMSLW